MKNSKITNSKSINTSSILGAKQVCAHKGITQHGGGNTIDAIHAAIRRGYKICEVDVSSSLDNVLFLHHDPEIIIDNHKYLITAENFDTIGKGKTTLSHLFTYLRDKDIVLNLDCNEKKRLLKSSYKRVFDIIREYGVQNKVYVEIPISKIIETCLYNLHDINLEIPVGGKLIWLKKIMIKCFTFSCPLVIILNRDNNSGIFEWAKSNHYKLSFWTADNLKDANNLLDSGYDFVGINS